MLHMRNALDSNYIRCACMCFSKMFDQILNSRVIIALSAKARHLSTAALYKGTIESKNRQMHWTIRYSYGATPVTNLDTHRASQAQQQSLSNLLGESTTAGDLPTKEGVSGTLASGRRRRLAPVRSAELLSCCCCSFWGLAGFAGLPRPSSRGSAPWDKLQQR